jgi:NADH-quinone oxidoreductase subunit L
MILAVLSIVGGYIGIPAILGGANHIHHFLEPVFGGSLENYGIATGHYSHALEYGMMGISIGIAVVGIALAYIMYLKKPELPGKFVASFQGLHRAVFNKWYMDEIYDTLFVNPTKRLGTFLWKGFDVVVVDGIVNGFGKVVNACSKGLRFTQSGFVHNYALSMVIGVLVIVGIYVLR